MMLRDDVESMMQELCMKLHSIGVESLLVTVDLADNPHVSVKGSENGIKFLTDLKDVAFMFAQFCQGIHQASATKNKTVTVETEILTTKDSAIDFDHEKMILEESSKYIPPCKSVEYLAQNRIGVDVNSNVDQFENDLKVQSKDENSSTQVIIVSKIQRSRGKSCSIETKKCKQSKIPAEEQRKAVKIVKGTRKKKVKSQPAEVHLDVPDESRKIPSCPQCQREFCSFFSLRKHLLKVCKIEPGLVDEMLPKSTCSICGDSFSNVNHLHLHVRLEHRADPTDFHVKRLDVQKEFEIIRARPEKDYERFVCHLCKKILHRRRRMERHIVDEHSKEYTCKKCGIMCTSLAQVRKHSASHLNAAEDIPLNRTEGSGEDIKALRRTEGSGEPHEVRCNQCGKSFSDKPHLKRHLLSHEKKYVKLHSCSVCGKSLQSKRALENHMKVHNPEYPCTFEGCDEQFSTDYHRQVHMKSHYSKEVMCTYCGKVCKSRGALNHHEKTIHTDIRPHVCQVCGEKFKTKDVLERHARRHNDPKHYMCEICGKGFTQISTLNYHKSVHSGIRRHKCSLCDASFKKVISLQVHKLRTNHFAEGESIEDLKYDECKVCGKKFLGTGEKGIKPHMRIHSGERPFSCTICSKSFSDLSNLRYHTKLHQDYRPFKCTLCGKEFTRNRELNKHMNAHQTSQNKLEQVTSAAIISLASENSEEERSIRSEHGHHQQQQQISTVELILAPMDHSDSQSLDQTLYLPDMMAM
ncbi:hypothetical protein ACJMK2_035403 [Sinanodonta woodiana]|uniref:Zinc finger protein 865 n=1 Tax=Sinanodonta woodiana TaxID=1069815 RepID=A0ABD3WW56_SINWO